MNIKLKLTKVDGQFIIDQPSEPGMPYIGRGATIIEAIGRYFHNNQQTFGITFDVDDSAWPDELARREHELAKR